MADLRELAYQDYGMHAYQRQRQPILCILVASTKDLPRDLPSRISFITPAFFNPVSWRALRRRSNGCLHSSTLCKDQTFKHILFSSHVRSIHRQDSRINYDATVTVVDQARFKSEI